MLGTVYLDVDLQDRRWWPPDVSTVKYLHAFRQMSLPYSHLDCDAQVCEDGCLVDAGKLCRG